MTGIEEINGVKDKETNKKISCFNSPGFTTERGKVEVIPVTGRAVS
jgi:hypothetical protein